MIELGGNWQRRGGSGGSGKQVLRAAFKARRAGRPGPAGESRRDPPPPSPPRGPGGRGHHVGILRKRCFHFENKISTGGFSTGMIPCEVCSLEGVIHGESSEQAYADHLYHSHNRLITARHGGSYTIVERPGPDVVPLIVPYGMQIPKRWCKAGCERYAREDSAYCDPCERRYPASLLKATVDQFDYLLRVRTGEVLRFASAVIFGDYVLLENGGGVPSFHEQGAILVGVDRFAECARGIEVRVDDIVWCCDGPHADRFAEPFWRRRA